MSDEAAVYMPPGNKRIVTGLLMLCTLMVVLDVTIANVALPHMSAALGATPDSIAWVLTSYILASAVATPMTGWLGGQIGRRQLFLAAVAGFTISSMLCGIAASLPMMVAARFTQGACAAFVIPLSQAFLYDINSKKDQPNAIMLWGMGTSVGPVLGPVIGGYLTEIFNWRWVFFINVPIGAVAVGIIYFLMPNFPNVRRSFDRVGFILLALMLAGLQLVLDRGTSEDWFQSPEILIEAGVAMACAWMLIFHLCSAREPIIPGAIFRDKNFVCACAFIFFFGGVNTAGAALLAPMVQTLMGYPVYEAGWLMVPRGCAMIVSMMITTRATRFVDVRIVIVAGTALSVSALWMMSLFNLQMDSGPIFWSGLVLGFGLGMVLMPLNLLVAATMPLHLRTDGTAVFSLMRNFGGSVIVAVTSALLARNIQVNHAEMGGHVTAMTMPILNPGIVENFGLRSERGAAMFDLEITRQSMMISYANDYRLLALCLLAMLPLVLLMKPDRNATADHMALAE